MRVIRVSDYQEVSRIAARLVADQVRERPRPVLALPTGGTPLGMYQKLVDMVRSGDLDVGSVTTFNLDEYVGLPHDHEQSYHAFMRRHLFDQVQFDEARVHIPDGNAADPMQACVDYEAAVQAAGGLDLAILGIGANGHIAFNEPGCGLGSGVRVVRLSERTVLDNARFFADQAMVPRHAITMGVGTIRSARGLLLLASGEGKADALAAAIEGAVTSRCPASALQLHPSAVVLADEAAASKLSVRPWTWDEYREDPYASRFLFK